MKKEKKQAECQAAVKTTAQKLIENVYTHFHKFRNMGYPYSCIIPMISRNAIAFNKHIKKE